MVERDFIYIVRHGETARNRERRLQGRSDLPLNAGGRAQALRVREYFLGRGIHFDRVYSSPLLRAVETAEIISGAAPLMDTRLLEMDYGPYEGMSLADPAPEVKLFFSDFSRNPEPEGMESLAHVVERTGALLEELKALSKGPGAPGNVLIVTHAIAMKGLLEYLTPESHGSYWSKYIGNCSVYAAGFAEGEYTRPREILTLGYEPGV